MLKIDEEVLKAAKIPADAPINPSIIIGAILCDSEVRDRVLDIVVEEYLLKALARVRDYQAFHKRIGVPQPQPAPVKPKVTWQVTNVLGEVPGGQYVIKASLLYTHADRSSTGEWGAYNGHPNEAHKFTFLGQHPPKDIIDQYARRCEGQ